MSASTSPSVTVQFQIDSITNLAPPYNNTVIFYEMNTGESQYSAAAMGINAIGQTCFNNVTLTPDVTYSYFVSVQLANNIQPSQNCEYQTISSGLVMFNTIAWNSIFSAGGSRDPQNFGYPRVQNSSLLWLPPLPEQTHWILHEFTHLLGLGHILRDKYGVFLLPTPDSCASVMTDTLFGNCSSLPAPTNYTADDLNLLNKLY
ncbi:hypothetical protein [Beggiatoa leptomitoformis]|uniref:Uncharacterized protein n=1 Tax=Beggiatoa leptomitoformis TaxID=288004 RepID=A0A2N9YCD8_9GAMM|nr:hypothetical protein [Beggiatoa leptomitoformis]ALG66588.2 hypothetical protein AL038_01100 [Beggiatoa leptomitoformis]AUI68106.2 hypothetical protein BLE401_04935 [Beggiatoa leptomitoformis]